MPANKAIGVHSDLQYVLASSSTHGHLILAFSRLVDVQHQLKETLNVLCNFKGSELVGTMYTGLFRDDVRPILHADFVSSDSGSGMVHFAPGHGMDEYHLCLRNGIAALAPIDDRGRFTQEAFPNEPKLLLGKEVLQSGNGAVIDHLQSSGLLVMSHRYTHKYPYDWRSKQPVIIRATEQWFANVGEIQAQALQSLDTISFIPKAGEERLRSFVKSRQEWCISRQRAWGVPIPALYHRDTGQTILDESSISHITSVIQDRGIEAWWMDGKEDPVWTPPDLRNEDGSTPYDRSQDTMDVWFDSGTSWTQMDSPVSFPQQQVADVYLEGTDQHRGWFQSSLLTRVAYDAAEQGSNIPKAPFKTLITHGFTLDQHSRKMSKSIGNVISPAQIMDGTLLPPLRKKIKGSRQSDATEQQISHDAQGPDALRLWVASCDYTNDVVLSQTILKSINSTLSKYRVTFKLLLGLLDDFCPPEATAASDQLAVVHQIALMQLSKTFDKVQLHYESCEFNRAIQEINRYVNTDLSAFYFESIKDTVYADRYNSTDRAETQLVLLQIYRYLQTMLYPVTPLLIEEAWDFTTDLIKDLCGHPIHGWELVDIDAISKIHNPILERNLPDIQRANAAVKAAQEKARADKKMGSSLQSQAMFVIHSESGSGQQEAEEFFNRYRMDLEQILVVSSVDFCFDIPPPVVSEAEWSYKSDFELGGTKISAHVHTPQRSKCVRCWKYNAIRVEDETVAPLCQRCADVISDLYNSRSELFLE